MALNERFCGLKRLWLFPGGRRLWAPYGSDRAFWGHDVDHSAQPESYQRRFSL